MNKRVTENNNDLHTRQSAGYKKINLINKTKMVEYP